MCKLFCVAKIKQIQRRYKNRKEPKFRYSVSVSTARSTYVRSEVKLLRATMSSVRPSARLSVMLGIVIKYIEIVGKYRIISHFHGLIW